MNKINLMLHAHQPYVRHLEYEKFLEEDWLYEALNESYIPLLRMLKKLDENGIKTAVLSNKPDEFVGKILKKV